MISKAVVVINQALDEFVALQMRTHGRVVGRRFTRAVVVSAYKRATGSRLARGEVSELLQQYRVAQRRSGTHCEYRIGARGYGRAALWYVMDGPGLDPLDGEAMTVAHVGWVTRDLAARAASDTMRELIPAGAQHPTISKIVASTTTAIEQLLQQMVDRATAEADFYEQVTGRAATVVPPLTLEEEAMLAAQNGPTP